MIKIRNYLFLLIYLLSNTVLAGDGLGRLFLTPDQRTQLETVRAQRDRRLPATADADVAPAPAPVPQGPGVVIYNGVVRRSDGKSTVWINGKAVHERNRGKNDSDVNVLGVRRDGAVSVAIPQADRRASLKVGQSLAVTSGTIEESYLRRETLVRPQVNTPALTTPATAVPPAATPAPVAPVTAAATAKPEARPVRESDTKEADPESGASPAVRTPGK